MVCCCWLLSCFRFSMASVVRVTQDSFGAASVGMFSRLVYFVSLSLVFNLAPFTEGGSSLHNTSFTSNPNLIKRLAGKINILTLFQ
uniref:Putative secreted protein n=1 Tax=Anopheles darlingi TaxID=43151 RepID=A0A2M4DKH6_ANODA